MKNMPRHTIQWGKLIMPDNYKILDGKKFMWDGENYDGMEQAKTAEETYKKDNFETRILEESGKPLVYTRREVKEIVLDGEAPP
jgi:hypothetical protein